MNRIISDLLNKAFENGIAIKIYNDPDYTTTSFSNPKYKLIAINERYEKKQQLPFVIAHEISHVLFSDGRDAKYAFTLGSSNIYETSANSHAIRMLVPYYVDELDDIEQIDVTAFMKLFDIPSNMLEECKESLLDYVY